MAMGIDNIQPPSVSGALPLKAWAYIILCCGLLFGCAGDSESTAPTDIAGEDGVSSDAENTDIGVSADVIEAGDHGGSDTLPSDLGHDSTPDPPWTFGPADEEEMLWMETLTTEPTTWVASLDTSHALLLAEDGLWEWTTAATTPVTAPEDFDFSTLISAIKTADDSVVVLTHDNVYVVQEGALVVSPLAEGIGEETLHAMVRIPGEDDALWFGGAEGLHRWREGVLYTLDLGDLPTASPLLAYTSAPDGEERVWVSADTQIYELAEDDAGFQAWPDRDDLVGDQIKGGSLGGLWVRAGAELHRRHPDGLWDVADPGFDVATIEGTHHTPSLWLRSEDGALYRWNGDSLRESSGAPDGVHMAAEPEGSLLIAGAHGVTRAHPGRNISFSGVTDGAVLHESTEVGIEAAYPDLIDEVTAQIDDATAETLEAPFKVLIDVDALSDGLHLLSVHVTYNDGFPASDGELAFEVAHKTATWTDDIQPIAEVKCGLCHGQAGSLEFKLFTKDQWVDNINQIVNALETELMPPGPPLADETIDTIKLWRDLDFPD